MLPFDQLVDIRAKLPGPPFGIMDADIQLRSDDLMIEVVDSVKRIVLALCSVVFGALGARHHITVICLCGSTHDGKLNPRVLFAQESHFVLSFPVFLTLAISTVPRVSRFFLGTGFDFTGTTFIPSGSSDFLGAVERDSRNGLNGA